MADANNTATTATSAQTAQNDAVKADSAQTNVNTHTEPKTDSKGVSDGSKDGDKLSNLEALIQSAVDRATNKLGNENKNLRKQVEDLKKANMTDSEIKELEIKEREKTIAQKEKELAERENRLVAIKAIKEIGLDDGSDASLALVDFVMAEDEAGIKERVKTFDALVKRIVQGQVDKVFKTNGRNPAKGSASTATGDDKKDSVAVRLGQSTAKANKAAQSTLDYYTGGKKK